MGQKLFGVDISGIVARAVGPGLVASTLYKATTGTRESGNQAGGTQPTFVEHPCRGVETALEEQYVDTGQGQDMVRRTDVAVLLLGDTINGGNTVPGVGDMVRIGAAGKRRAVIRILDVDSAKATYLLAVRGP